MREPRNIQIWYGPSPNLKGNSKNEQAEPEIKGRENRQERVVSAWLSPP